jgi:hypothetical protein
VRRAPASPRWCLRQAAIHGTSDSTLRSIALLAVLLAGATGPGTAAAELEFLSWSLPSSPEYAAVDSGRLVFSSNAFVVLDVSDPSNPVQRGFLRPFEPGIPGCTVLSGGRAYAAWGGHGIRVLDVGDPAAPAVLSDNLDPAWSYSDLQLAAPHLFALARRGEEEHRFVTAKIGNDDRLALAGEFDLCVLPGGITSRHYPYRLLIEGGLALLTFGPRGENGPAVLHILSLADPAVPRYLASLELGEVAFGATLREKPHLAMAAEDGLLFVTGRFAGSARSDLAMVDLSDPSNPRLAASWDGGLDAAEVRVSGSRGFLTDRDGGLYALDLSDPLAPAVLDYLRVPLPAYYAIDFGLELDGGWVYLHHWDFYGIYTVDVSDPADMALTATVPFCHALNEVRARGNRLYAAVWDYLQLYALDVSDPVSPSVLSRTEALGFGWGLDLRGKYAYAAMGKKTAEGQTGGIQIFNVSDPAAPVLAGYREPLPGENHDVAVDVEDGEASPLYAYVAVGEPILWTDIQESERPGLRILDVTDPDASPAMTGFFEIPSGAQGRDVRKSGNHAHLAATDGLYIVDVSDPQQPFLAAHWGPGGRVARAVDVEGAYAYVAYGGDLFILDVSQPAVPKEVARFKTPTGCADVEVVGPYAYVLADGSLSVLDVSDPEHPLLAAQREGVTYGAAFVTASPPFGFTNSTGLFAFRFTGITPPSLTGVQRLSSPFRLKLNGDGFQQGLQAFIGEGVAPWSDVTVKSSAKAVLKGGNALKALFPEGQAVSIRLVNPDGGEATTAYTR